MKKSILFVMSLVLLASCTENKSFKVTGEATEGVKYVYYTYNFFDENPKLDSVKVDTGLCFVIEGENEADPVFVTGATDQNVQFWFISEPGEIKISKEGLPSGTPLNDAIKGFLEKANEVNTEAELDALLDSFMKEHPNDLAGAFCLYLLNDAMLLRMPFVKSSLQRSLRKPLRQVQDRCSQTLKQSMKDRFRNCRTMLARASMCL